MTKLNTITTVNGKTYDSKTGLPVVISEAPHTARQMSQQPATSLHASAPQKSKTLRRVPPQKTTPKKDTLNPMVTRRPQRRSLDIARHPQVRKSAPIAQKGTENPDIAPRTHPHVERANQRVASKKATHHPTPHKTPSSKEIKDTEIARAIENTSTKTVKHPRKQRSVYHKKAIRISVIILSITIVLSALIWINLPALSVKFAASQAGVSATIPHYTPEGFRFQWPIDTKDNHVAIKYVSPDTNTSFVISQSNSPWNSDAVRSMIEENSKGRFLTSRDRGITVYTHDGNAAWVNRGVLYTIEGDAGLSSDTIMRIANSF